MKDSLEAELRATIHALQHENHDLRKQNEELRDAVVALMEPEMPRVLLARIGIMVLDKK